MNRGTEPHTAHGLRLFLFRLQFWWLGWEGASPAGSLTRFPVC